MKDKFLSYSNFNLDKELEDNNFRIDLYERLLDELCNQLNLLHNIQWSKRSWRIMIGPWLNRYLVSFHRHINLYQKIKNSGEEKTISGIDTPENFFLASNDLNEFSIFLSSEKYKLKILSKIKEYFEKKFYNFNFIDAAAKLNNKKDKKNTILNKTNLIIIKILERFFCFNNDIVFYKIYFGNFYQTLKLFFKLRQFPFKYNLFEDIPQFYIDKSLRKKIEIKKKGYSEKENLLREFLVETIPSTYIEGFKLRLKKAKSSYFPKKTKIIYSCNIYSDYLFKYWAADQLNEGAKLVYGQHGATYNAFIYDDRFEHEKKISDLFLTWGWKSESKKVVPCGVFSVIGRTFEKASSNNKILFLPGISSSVIETIFQKLMDHEQNKSIYPSQVFKLVECLHMIKKENIKKIYIKPHPNEKNYENKISSKFKKFPEIKFLNSKIDPLKIVKNYDLILFANLDSTTFYQLISSNKPCVVIVNDYESILKEDYKQLWNEMIEAKIFHKSSLSLSNFFNETDNLLNWWNSAKTQKAVLNFNLLNCKNDKNVISKIAKEILNFKNDSF